MTQEYAQKRIRPGTAKLLKRVRELSAEVYGHHVTELEVFHSALTTELTRLIEIKKRRESK